MIEQIVKLSHWLNLMPPNALNSTPAPPPKPVAPPAPISAVAAHSMPYVDHGLSKDDMLAFLGETVVNEVGSR